MVQNADFVFSDCLEPEINHILKEALKACLFPVLLIFVGLIPVIGLPIVFMLESHLMGREGVIVYLDSLTNQEEAVELRKMWRWMPIRIGWLPAFLAFIPFVGWLFLLAAYRGMLAAPVS